MSFLDRAFCRCRDSSGVYKFELRRLQAEPDGDGVSGPPAGPHSPWRSWPGQDVPTHDVVELLFVHQEPDGFGRSSHGLTTAFQKQRPLNTGGVHLLQAGSILPVDPEKMDAMQAGDLVPPVVLFLLDGGVVGRPGVHFN